jgi:hypothetical protein
MVFAAQSKDAPKQSHTTNVEIASAQKTGLAMTSADYSPANGSAASRRPSPTKLKDTTVASTNRAGINDHGC